jgi:hypothetical protein
MHMGFAGAGTVDQMFGNQLRRLFRGKLRRFLRTGVIFNPQLFVEQLNASYV